MHRLFSFVIWIERRMFLSQLALMLLRNNLVLFFSCHCESGWMVCCISESKLLSPNWPRAAQKKSFAKTWCSFNLLLAVTLEAWLTLITRLLLRVMQGLGASSTGLPSVRQAERTNWRGQLHGADKGIASQSGSGMGISSCIWACAIVNTTERLLFSQVLMLMFHSCVIVTAKDSIKAAGCYAP